jgi:RNA polymerase sigma factor (sigma-70 family)
MNMNLLLDYPSLTDRRLVELHLDGDREAFRQIVERYQAMVCALGLSACGDVGRSEDVAQEVFVAAWRQLPELRDPDKLRGWLAGIARNLVHNAFRRHQRTPLARAEELSPETPADMESPREQAIGTDEAALMWNTIEGIPENYREPMVLFYREQPRSWRWRRRWRFRRRSCARGSCVAGRCLRSAWPGW